jgi:hypothetical protein
MQLRNCLGRAGLDRITDREQTRHLAIERHKDNRLSVFS